MLSFKMGVTSAVNKVGSLFQSYETCPEHPPISLDCTAFSFQFSVLFLKDGTGIHCTVVNFTYVDSLFNILYFGTKFNMNV